MKRPLTWKRRWVRLRSLPPAIRLSEPSELSECAYPGRSPFSWTFQVRPRAQRMMNAAVTCVTEIPFGATTRWIACAVVRMFPT